MTEGDSAKTSAIAGISALSREERSYYGVLPLRGKVLNVRKNSQAVVNKNETFNAIIKAWGLNYNLSYDNQKDLDTLRYGHLVIMADQDVDGSHIKGLILNFVQNYWPALVDRVSQFITPIIIAKKKSKKIEFYSETEFEEWFNSQSDAKSWTVKYYKGLGTFTSTQFREYFGKLDEHIQPFINTGETSAESLENAFGVNVEPRKHQIMNFTHRTTDSGLSVENFVESKIGEYFYSDTARSLSSIVDGLKDSQRKVLWVCLNRKNTEIKVRDFFKKF